MPIVFNEESRPVKFAKSYNLNRITGKSASLFGGKTLVPSDLPIFLPIEELASSEKSLLENDAAVSDDHRLFLMRLAKRIYEVEESLFQIPIEMNLWLVDQIQVDGLFRCVHAGN